MKKTLRIMVLVGQAKPHKREEDFWRRGKRPTGRAGHRIFVEVVHPNKASP